MRAVLLLSCVLLAPAASAQTAPDGIGGDARFLTLNYGASGIFHIPTSPDTVQTVLFGQDEAIRSIILSDPGAYMVSVSGKGDSLTLRPNGPSSLAMMNVRTDARTYEIELVAGGRGSTPPVVRFAYGQSQRALPPRVEPSQAKGFAYRLSGSGTLRPLSISDDGAKTYLEWKRDQAIPAVFAVGPSGKEEMVDGYMREGLFTIDRVHGELVFRIDRERAIARRTKKRDADDHD